MVEGLVNLCAVLTVPGLAEPAVVNCCPVVATTFGELVLTPTGVVSLCPAVGVPARGVPEGLANLAACPVVVTVAGELVRTPAEDDTVSHVVGILCPIVEVPARGVLEGLANLAACPEVVTTAGELVRTPAEDSTVPAELGILCPAV